MMWYVYEDRKPDGEVFYVGIGTLRRIKQKERNQFHSNICAKYPDWNREIVAEFSSKEECCILERELIKKYGRRDLENGTLTNLTDGGEHSPNIGPYTIQKLSIHGKKGIKKVLERQKQLGAAFYNSDVQSKNGRAAAQRETFKDACSKGGSIANSLRYECIDCGYQSNPGGVGLHLKRTGHIGKKRIK